MTAAPANTTPPVESPCIKVCVLDARSLCVGCGRTLDEIAAWSRLSADEQRAVRAKAAERLGETHVEESVAADRQATQL